jgi:hypothetical protein
MSLLSRLAIRVLLILWAGYTALAQPGLPACWLEREACEVHPHFGPYQATHPHSHDYLLDQAKASAAQGLPHLLAPLSLLIEILFLSRLLRPATSLPVAGQGWTSAPEPPPPRTAASS